MHDFLSINNLDAYYLTLKWKLKIKKLRKLFSSSYVISIRWINVIIYVQYIYIIRRGKNARYFLNICTLV